MDISRLATISALCVALATGCSTIQHTDVADATRYSSDSTASFRERYDSVFILRETSVSALHDTIFISRDNTEYRYRFVHDTVSVVHTDTIPYRVTVTQVREVPRKRTLLDKTAYTGMAILLISTTLKLKRLWK